MSCKPHAPPECPSSPSTLALHQAASDAEKSSLESCQLCLWPFRKACASEDCTKTSSGLIVNLVLKFQELYVRVNSLRVNT
ncbi:hypothetical protein E2C01_076007 [Portunus trituberculatus]|uniref:Uncharacterized protein n=1 Tax=Portunus trituberculatus TaxID=210409 RepID=A0A5B7IGD9_PORTR|nr:hypothetical protein [Portunus trituberculatus]